jgi:PiT family inorganic phosphate transporter
MAFLLVALTLAVAFGNGANDVSKGVATLVGAGLTTERRAILWGTGWTVLGAAAAALVSQRLVATFSGAGLLNAPRGGLLWPAAVATGVIGWLLIATRAGMPVSTTHALVGAIVGSGLAAAGPAGVQWTGVLGRVALPLLLSPLLALALVRGLLPLASAGFRRIGGYCVCLERRELTLATAMPGATAVIGRELHVLAGTECPPEVVTRVNALDSLHWLTAGFTSFARGLNDAPKILAIGLVAGAALGLEAAPLLALVALAMGAGSWFAGRRVTRTLATKVTPMSGADGLAANVVTSSLVALASGFGWPVSTTHVAGGTVIGIGLRRREIRWKMVSEMLLAWVVTVPVAGALAWAFFTAVSR